MEYTPSHVSVLIGHLPERAEMLRKVRRAYEEQGVLEVLVQTGLPGGAAYNRLVDLSKGDVVALVPDDQVPWDGAIEAALKVLNAGFIPCNRLTEGDVGFRPGYDDAPDGVELDWTRAMFIAKATFRTVGPMIPELSWFIDYDYSRRLLEAGYKLVSCAGFGMHHLHGDQSWLQGGEAERQHEIYRERQ